MLLGKRARGPMRRTTSMTEFGFELGEPEGGQGAMQREDWMNSAAVVPRGGGGRRRNSGEFVVEMASFLKACGLCKRRLGTGRDIFMYRGDIAFCSLECRQQQMNLDERKEKCSLTSMKKDTPPVATGSESSSNGETIAAA